MTTKEILERYDAARKAFLMEIKAITEDAQKGSMDARFDSDTHDYLKYVGASIGSVAQAVALHNVLSMRAWKRDFCGGGRHGSKELP